MTELVIAVHPDDETLGAGGTLLKSVHQGNKVVWVIVTRDRNNYHRQSQIVDRVRSSYGFADLIWLDFDCARLDTSDLYALVQHWEEILDRVEPERLYIPWEGDIHSDHRIVAESLKVCFKNHRFPFIQEILAMEVISETDFGITASSTAFVPNVFVDVEDVFEKKMEILSLYSDQIAPHPFPRSIEAIKALAILRGRMIGKVYAEAFNLLFSKR